MTKAASVGLDHGKVVGFFFVFSSANPWSNLYQPQHPSPKKHFRSMSFSPKSSPPKFKTQEEEEEELRQRVRRARLQRFEQEQLQQRVAITREGSQIRAEIARLRQQIINSSSSNINVNTVGSSSSEDSSSQPASGSSGSSG